MSSSSSSKVSSYSQGSGSPIFMNVCFGLVDRSGNDVIGNRFRILCLMGSHASSVSSFPKLSISFPRAIASFASGLFDFSSFSMARLALVLFNRVEVVVKALSSPIVGAACCWIVGLQLQLLTTSRMLCTAFAIMLNWFNRCSSVHFQAI